MMPGNPVVGGTVLRRAAIQSPNFEQGPPIVGWAINADGSAFFGDVTAEGTITASSCAGTDFLINSAGIFVYSGTPAAGNLIASVAAANGTDGFGNAYVAGVTSYAGSTYASMDGGQIQLQAGGEFQAAQLGAAGAGESFLSSGLETSGDIAAEVILQSQGSAGQSTVVLSAAQVTAVDNMTINGNLTVNGTFINGGSTGTAQPAGTPTGGPNGGTFAGHTHDFDGHTHPL